MEVIKGDCLKEMLNIPDKSVDMILCDLPYGTTQNRWDSVIDLKLLWNQYERIIKDNGAIVLFGSQPFTTVLNHSNLKLFRYEWIWEKNNSTGFQLANKRPMKKHEIISVFYKKQPTYNPQGIIEHNKVNRRGCSSSNWSELKSDSYVQRYTNYPTQILKFAYDKKKLHPTQKPVALCEYLIKTYTNEGELVLDNTAGSGSTGVACINTNRKCILIEQDEEYVEIIKQRLSSL